MLLARVQWDALTVEEYEHGPPTAESPSAYELMPLQPFLLGVESCWQSGLRPAPRGYGHVYPAEARRYASCQQSPLSPVTLTQMPCAVLVTAGPLGRAISPWLLHCAMWFSHRNKQPLVHYAINDVPVGPCSALNFAQLHHRADSSDVSGTHALLWSCGIPTRTVPLSDLLVALTQVHVNAESEGSHRATTVYLGDDYAPSTWQLRQLLRCDSAISVVSVACGEGPHVSWLAEWLQVCVGQVLTHPAAEINPEAALDDIDAFLQACLVRSAKPFRKRKLYSPAFLYIFFKCRQASRYEGVNACAYALHSVTTCVMLWLYLCSFDAIIPRQRMMRPLQPCIQPVLGGTWDVSIRRWCSRAVALIGYFTSHCTCGLHHGLHRSRAHSCKHSWTTVCFHR